MSSSFVHTFSSTQIKTTSYVYYQLSVCTADVDCQNTEGTIHPVHNVDLTKSLYEIDTAAGWWTMRNLGHHSSSSNRWPHPFKILHVVDVGDGGLWKTRVPSIQ